MAQVDLGYHTVPFDKYDIAIYLDETDSGASQRIRWHPANASGTMFAGLKLLNSFWICRADLLTGFSIYHRIKIQNTCSRTSTWAHERLRASRHIKQYGLNKYTQNVFADGGDRSSRVYRFIRDEKERGTRAQYLERGVTITVSRPK